MKKRALAALREYRVGADKTLDDLVADLKKKRGFRTTKATLSRIENGEHPVSLEMLPHLRAVTGLSGAQLRPDLAEHFDGAAA